MKVIKYYLTGLLVIAVIVQPWFFGSFIGLNMSYPVLGYMWAVIIELTIAICLVTPYFLGRKILEDASGRD